MHGVRSGTVQGMSTRSPCDGRRRGPSPEGAEPPARRAGQPRRDDRDQGGERLRGRRPRRLAAGRLAAPARRLLRRLPLPLGPRAARQRRAAAAAGRVRSARLGVGARADEPGAAAARRPRAAAPEPAAPARAARRRTTASSRRRCSCTPTTASRCTSTSTCCWRPTSSRCSRSAGSWRPGRGAGVAVERMENGVRFAVAGRDGRHRATTITADRPCEPRDGAAALRFALSLAPGGRGDDHAALRAPRGRRAGAGSAGAGAAPAARTRASPSAWLARAHDGGDRRRAVQPRAAALAARHADAALAARRGRLLRGGRAVVRDAVRPRLADRARRRCSRSTRRWRSRRCACSPG